MPLLVSLCLLLAHQCPPLAVLPQSVGGELAGQLEEARQVAALQQGLADARRVRACWGCCPAGRCARYMLGMARFRLLMPNRH